MWLEVVERAGVGGGLSLRVWWWGRGGGVRAIESQMNALPT